MAIRIRVYPQNGMGMMGGMGMYGGGAVSAQTYYTSKLNTLQQISNLRLGYERALFNEKLDKVRLEERLKNPYLMNAGMVNPLMGAYGLTPAVGGLGTLGTLGALGALGGLGGGIGGLGSMLPLAAMGGSGQTNVTNQTSPGGTGSQTVSNVNTYSNSNVVHSTPPFGMPAWGGYPQPGLGGWFGRLF